MIDIIVIVHCSKRKYWRLHIFIHENSHSIHSPVVPSPRYFKNYYACCYYRWNLSIPFHLSHRSSFAMNEQQEKVCRAAGRNLVESKPRKGVQKIQLSQPEYSFSISIHRRIEWCNLGYKRIGWTEINYKSLNFHSEENFCGSRSFYWWRIIVSFRETQAL